MQGTANYRTIYHDYSSIPLGRANAVAGRANSAPPSDAIVVRVVSPSRILGAEPALPARCLQP